LIYSNIGTIVGFGGDAVLPVVDFDRTDCFTDQRQISHQDPDQWKICWLAYSNIVIILSVNG